jgi:hypothetical protein
MRFRNWKEEDLEFERQAGEGHETPAAASAPGGGAGRLELVLKAAERRALHRHLVGERHCDPVVLLRRCHAQGGPCSTPPGGGRACGSGRSVMRKRTSGAATISLETASRRSSEKEGINSETVEVRR